MSKRQPVVAAAEDPLWYKDAVIYQVHLKSFFDSNDDGVGDFHGLISKLDYIAELGVTAIWLLPFYPSPRKDDGYDIAEYRGVHPDYGTLADAKRFIAKAHERGIRVITELVVNHTSDRHPWFQRARKAPKGSPHRDFYVWSDSDRKYDGTRIIFTDTEKSNWTWDETAKAYYWHRFFSHQPDLNFDNPAVQHEVLEIMRFWLDLGVDGMRLDAVPYLVERDGTDNENLPGTHEVLRTIRAALDAHSPGRLLLAEANQWPEDAQQYFGDADECHMCFHFPLMPRMYMAIAQEDRFPIVDIMRQTPAIPEACQWAVFLRNHDELTLEMVSDSERDYLWNSYAADRRARINLGIRRRLAPLMDHDRRRIELMNGLLLSMPGTPVIYYGDEIGMGDNIHLGDRDGVRTPMQWSPDRAGGFSRAAFADLVLPPVVDGIYGFDAVNVEAQDRDPSSLLNWTRRMLAVRRRHKAFGRGSQTFLHPGNRRILAFFRAFEGETILCVYNLSRNAQAAELDLEGHDRLVLVDVLGGAAFPTVKQGQCYPVTLPPYGFYWFILCKAAAMPSWYTPPTEPLPELHTLVVPHDGVDELLALHVRTVETEALPEYLKRRRWFASKDQAIETARLRRVDELPGDDGIRLAEVEVTLPGRVERYHLPLGISWDGDAHHGLAERLGLARVRQRRRLGVLTDAFTLDGFALALLAAMRSRRTAAIEGGELRFDGTAHLDALDLGKAPEIRRMSAEQSNSSLVIGGQLVMKLMRRAVDGTNPEVEMVRHLTAHGYPHTPPLMGEAARVTPDGEQSIVVAQAFVENQGDAWEYTLSFLKRFAEAVGTAGAAPEAREEMLAGYRATAAAIGTALGQLHALLAQPSDDAAFAPAPADAAARQGWVAGATAQLKAAFDVLQGAKLDGEAARDAGFVLRHRDEIEAALPELAAGGSETRLTRVHGDFHLGQVLVSGARVFIIDFEGEPSKPLNYRRGKNAALRDVAGALRSFDYAAAAALDAYGASASGSSGPPVEGALRHFVQDMEAAFSDAYEAAHEPPARSILDLFLLEKSAYEICYEAANRPAWLPIPLRGFAEIAGRILNLPPEAAHG